MLTPLPARSIHQRMVLPVTDRLTARGGLSIRRLHRPTLPTDRIRNAANEAQC
jgi:hypothetical protein